MADAGSGFERVAALADVPDGGCLAVECGGAALVVVRRGDRIAAFENRCPHAGAPLSEGFVEGATLTCAWHGWTFDLETGRSVDDASVALPRFEARVEDGAILVRTPA